MKDGIEQRVEGLWAAVMAGDEYAAIDSARVAVESGIPIETMLLDVVGAVQARVGQEWADNRVTVAQEHTATAVNERVLAFLAHHSATRNNRAAPNKGRLSVACVEGEWHTFPARLLAEVLRLRGWEVDYLGAHVPTQHLIVHLHRADPDTVALSDSIATRLPAAHGAITACQAAGTPVLVGGAAFGPDGRYARLLGADAWAPDARAAADLLSDGPLPRRPAASMTDEPPHPVDHEYSELTDRRGGLVRRVMDALHRQAGEPGPHGGELPRYTPEDVAYIVDYLRTSVYVDDPELFTSFVEWMTRMLRARGVPAGAMDCALTAMDDCLSGLPHARDTLARARQ
ncbi:cobalamin-dependent protein [Nonomuraea sp. NPDC050404]|uniref:cobalamin-dependent protein n=1 Tax=Nonomuraea sp. NPDC050404 TaxID=3155783 RepID=UPI003407FC28